MKQNTPILNGTVSDRVGVVFKGQELFIHKDRIINSGVDESKLWMSDGRLTIEINVNNL